MTQAICRLCAANLTETFVDLGMSPLANSYLAPEQLNRAEKFYPLRAYVSEDNFLVQLEEFETPDHIFSDYAYFSSFSDTWLKHAKDYVDLMIERFGFGRQSQIIEIASNDGYLLQYFQEKGLNLRVDFSGIQPQEHLGPVRMRGRAFALITEHGRLIDQNTLKSNDPNQVLEKLTERQSVFTKADLEFYLQKHLPLESHSSFMKTFWKQKEIVPLVENTRCDIFGAWLLFRRIQY